MLGNLVNKVISSNSNIFTNFSSSDQCPKVPFLQNVPLPEVCKVFYHNGSYINSTVYVNIGHCSQDICSSSQGPCQDPNTRCCCQPLKFTELQYICHNEESQLYSHVVASCGCKPCNLNISFVGFVLAPDGSPLPLANILIDRKYQIISDQYGLFGFTVSGLQSHISVTASIIPYAPYLEVIPINPGIVNLVFIQLRKMMSVPFLPQVGPPLVISMIDLDRYNSTLEYLIRADNVKGDSAVVFPPEIPKEECQFQIFPIELNSQESIFKLKKSFTTTSNDGTSKRDIVSDVLVAVAFGSLRMINNFGQQIQINSSLALDIISFISSTYYRQEDLLPLQLYLYNTAMNMFEVIDTSPQVAPINEGFSVQFEMPNPQVPFTYIIAYREINVCYTISRVMKTQNGALEGSEVTCTVVFMTQVAPRSITLRRTTSHHCVAIPCRGSLTIVVDDPFNSYQPSVITHTLSSNAPVMPGPIHSTLEDCINLGENGDSHLYFFTFTQVTSLPQSSPTDTLDTPIVESALYCYMQLELIICPEYTTKVSSISTFEGGSPIQHLRYFDDQSDTENDLGSAIGCSKKQRVCMEYVCDPDSIVNITVSHCSDNCHQNEYMSCAPTINSHSPNSLMLTNLAHFTSTYFVFDSTETVPGLYVSETSSDIAFYKCELGDTVALRFECNVAPNLELD